MRLIIHHAAKASNTPVIMLIIYFFAFSVFSSFHREDIYIIPTRHMPRTAIIAVISCNFSIKDQSLSVTSPISSGPGSHTLLPSMPTRSAANVLWDRKYQRIKY